MKPKFTLFALTFFMISTPINAVNVKVEVAVHIGKDEEGDSETADSSLTTTGANNSAGVVKADMNDVHFLLWTRSNSADAAFYELLINNLTNLAASPLNASRPTIVLVHGWLGSGRSGWPLYAKTGLLFNLDCNVISIDWGKIANNTDYFAVVNNLPYVGMHSAYFFEFLHSKASLDLASLHIVGHSLGAHLSGFLGSGVVNGPIGRITGLDPAGPGFTSTTKDKRIDPSDATFVEIIHTNGCPLSQFCAGLEANLGHVDYYPNGGKLQPGCKQATSLEELLTDQRVCSHALAPVFWIESINGATAFKSKPCADWDTYKAGGCPDCGQGCLNMGFHASTKLNGTYYLETNAKFPYAQG